MKYIVYSKNPHHHLIDIELIIGEVKEKELLVQLPAWRPGRYELANFAQNIKTFSVTNEKGKALAFKKVTKDLWKINSGKNSTIRICYSYYANEINAGSSFVDGTQLYVNGVNCFLYVSDRINDPCELELKIPDDYEVATGLKEVGNRQFSAKDYHALADSPFIASNTLQKSSYKVKGTEFTLWFQGEIKPNWEKLLNHFTAFTKTQLKMMGSFPFKAYHFLFQILPHKAYHGVEHQNSTVIALGPSYELMTTEWYEELVGVSSHELFHAWNVKAIRPIEMAPYNYANENYSRLGYVAEGVTTYYGDLFLLRSGFFNEQSYLKTFEKLLERHFNNFGRLNLSVADSSYDTWLDGYKPGVPGRKTSIYVEGALCAFMLDINIRRLTKNKKSLDDVMAMLYQKFGHGKGFSESEYKKIAEEVAGDSLDDFFEKYLWGTTDYKPELESCLEYLGFHLQSKKDISLSEKQLGFKTQLADNKTIVAAVFPNSIADHQQLQPGDEIIAVNNYRVEDNLDKWIDYFSGEKILELAVVRGKKLKSVELQLNHEVYYENFKVAKQKKLTAAQKVNFKKWSTQ